MFEKMEDCCTYRLQLNLRLRDEVLSDEVLNDYNEKADLWGHAKLDSCRICRDIFPSCDAYLLSRHDLVTHQIGPVAQRMSRRLDALDIRWLKAVKNLAENPNAGDALAYLPWCRGVTDIPNEERLWYQQALIENPSTPYSLLQRVVDYGDKAYRDKAMQHVNFRVYEVGDSLI